MPSVSAVFDRPPPVCALYSEDTHRSYALSIIQDYSPRSDFAWINSLDWTVSLRFGPPLAAYQHEIVLSGPDAAKIARLAPVFSFPFMAVSRSQSPLPHAKSTVLQSHQPLKWFKSILEIPGAVPATSPAQSTSASPSLSASSSVAEITPASLSPPVAASPIPVDSKRAASLPSVPPTTEHKTARETAIVSQPDFVQPKRFARSPPEPAAPVLVASPNPFDALSSEPFDEPDSPDPDESATDKPDSGESKPLPEHESKRLSVLASIMKDLHQDATHSKEFHYALVDLLKSQATVFQAKFPDLEVALWDF